MSGYGSPFSFPNIARLMSGPAFDAQMAAYGARMTWRKSHTCPCTGGSADLASMGIPGGADPACKTCGGLAVYWDAPSAPFTGLITFIHLGPTPDEPGVHANQVYGQAIVSEPIISIPYTNNTAVYFGASMYDVFTEIDAPQRLNAELVVGGTPLLPYQEQLVVAPTGAVTIYDQVNKVVTRPSSYTVSGASVTLSGYPVGTRYVVEFTAAPMYVTYRSAGGLPHVRPFGGTAATNFPRRFRAQSLDMWTRGQIQNAQNLQVNGSGFPVYMFNTPILGPT